MNSSDSQNVQNGGSGFSDEALLAKFVAGDQEAFAQIVLRYERELYSFILRYVSDQTTAEDLFQETFVQLHRSAHTFDPDRRLRPWLFTIAANKARDYLRASARRSMQPLDAQSNGEDSATFANLLPGTGADAPTAAMLAEDAQRVRDVLSAMSPMQREVIILSFYQRLSYKEMAEILNVPLGTVKSRLHIALGQFARLYKARTQEKG